MSDKYFLDTNVLVYAHDSEYPEKQKKAQEVILEGMRSGGGVISTQVLSEFFVTITQKIKKPLSIDQAKKEIVLLSNLEIAEIDTTLIIRAIDLMLEHQLNYWDSLILSAAQRHHCLILYSEDFTDGRKFSTLRISNIFK